MEQGNYQFYFNKCTRYTKMGYSGNMEPAFIIPSAVADKVGKVFMNAFIIFIS